MGIVRLGIITTLALVPRYRGKTTATSCPCATNAFGSASTTSARPPVFENGSPSDATKSILTRLSLLDSLNALRGFSTSAHSQERSRDAHSFYATGPISARQDRTARLQPPAALPATLSAHGSSTTRPTLSRGRRLARTNRARHWRFSSLDPCGNVCGGSIVLLDRSRRRPRRNDGVPRVHRRGSLCRRVGRDARCKTSATH